MRAVLAALVLCACGAGVPGDAPPPRPRSLEVTPLVAPFDGPFEATNFAVSGIGFAATANWDALGAHQFFFSGERGVLGPADVDRHAWRSPGGATGSLEVSLLDSRLRGQSYVLCLSLSTAETAPVACSAPILFAQQ